MCSIDEKYIDCITVTCPNDCSSSASVCDYSPGCNFGPFDLSLANCVAFELAKALNMFQFDFYNDWVNGSLFSFLLKYKRKGNKEERFCEYNCEDLAGGGVDGNSDGSSDNPCRFSLLSDTCVGSGSDAQKETVGSVSFYEGLIKKNNNELYYAASTKHTEMKLFATEIINLGGVFDCDWQGIPKIQPSLIPTTYKLPPDSQENDDNGVMNVSAIVYINNHNDCGDFFSIDCLGLHTDGQQCLNIRHLCEIGVNIDETQYDANYNIISPANCNIGSVDIDDNKGKWFRDVFTKLNSPILPYLGVNSIPSGVLATDFNTGNLPYYDYVSTANNGVDYKNFRGYGFNHNQASDVQGFMQPEHSYYFYFGLEPGSTGLDKMNAKFFTPCVKNLRDDIVIESNSTVCANHLTNGTITFSFIGGFGPFTYTVTGLNTLAGVPFSYSNTGTVAASSQNVTIGGLAAGTYLISGVDNNGVPVSDVITVNGPTSLYCSSFVSSNPTGTTGTGSISITSVGGGISPYRYTLTNWSGGTVNIPGQNASGEVSSVLPMKISNLAIDRNSGYTMTITDSDTPPNRCVTTGLTITGPSFLNVKVVPTNIHCFGEKTGALAITVTNGFRPLNITVTGMTGPLYDTVFPTQSVNSSGIVNQLNQGQYGVTVIDSHGTKAYIHDISTLVACPNPELKIEKALPQYFSKQCDPNNYRIPFKILSGLANGALVDCLVSPDNTNWFPYSTVSGSNLYNNPDANGNIYLTIPSSSSVIATGIYIKFQYSNSGPPMCESNIINYGANSIAIPPNLLAITESAQLLANNLKQCDSTTATINLGISHLDAGFTGRGPYTLEYKLESMSAPSTTTQIFASPFQLVGLNSTAIPTNNTVKFYMKITDKKGCIFPADGSWYQYTATLPTSNLIATKISTTGSNPNFYHKITASGGIGNHFYNGTQIPTAGLTVGPSTSGFFIGVITDSVGCTFNLMA